MVRRSAVASVGSRSQHPLATTSATGGSELSLPPLLIDSAPNAFLTPLAFAGQPRRVARTYSRRSAYAGCESVIPNLRAETVALPFSR
jgi:hypothetical protein